MNNLQLQADIGETRSLGTQATREEFFESQLKGTQRKIKKAVTKNI